MYNAIAQFICGVIDSSLFPEMTSPENRVGTCFSISFTARIRGPHGKNNQFISPEKVWKRASSGGFEFTKGVTILAIAPSNYIKILEQILPNPQSPGPYSKSGETWHLHTDHDSCWRDAIRDILYRTMSDAMLILTREVSKIDPKFADELYYHHPQMDVTATTDHPFRHSPMVVTWSECVRLDGTKTNGGVVVGFPAHSHGNGREFLIKGLKERFPS